MESRRILREWALVRKWALLSLFLMLLLLPREALAGKMKVKGDVYTSAIPKGTELTLTGATVLHVNKKVELGSITGDYSLTIDSSSGYLLIVKGGKYGIDVSSLSLSGKAEVQGETTGIEVSGKITIQKKAELTATGAKYGMHSDSGRIDLYGKVHCTGKESDGINAGGNISIYGTADVSAESLGGEGDGLYSHNGAITIYNGSKTQAQGARYGIYARKGVVTQYGGTVRAEGGTGDGIRSGTGFEILNGVCSASGKRGIACGGSFVNRGGDVSARSKTYGIYSEGDGAQVLINGGVTIARGEAQNGIHTKGEILLKAGYVQAVGRINSFYGENGIRLTSPMGFVVPEGAWVSEKMVVAQNGWPTTFAAAQGTISHIYGDVTIDSLSDQKAGCTLEATVSGQPSTSMTITWQKRSDSAKTWETIPVRSDLRYVTGKGEEALYYRALVSVVGYAGHLTSNTLFIDTRRAIIETQPVAALTMVGKKFSFTVKAKNATSYSWKIYPKGSDWPYDMDYIKKHAEISTFSGGAGVTIRPLDTELNGMYIGCTINEGTEYEAKSEKVRMSVSVPASTPTPTPTVSARPRSTPTPSPTSAVTRPTGPGQPGRITPSAAPGVVRPTIRPTQTPTPTPTFTPTPTSTPKPTFTPTPKPTFTPAPTPTPPGFKPIKGAKFQAKDGAFYLLTSETEAEYFFPPMEKSTVVVPAKISYGGYSFKVTSIGTEAFRGNTNLFSVEIGNNVTKIGKRAFMNCKALMRVTKGKKVKSILEKAFYGCELLDDLVIGSSVSKIGKSAFQGCKGLRKLTVKTGKLTASNVGEKAFQNTYAKMKVIVPSGKASAYQTLFRSKGLGKKATVSAG